MGRLAMIRQRFYDKATDWKIHVYYVVTEPNANEILQRLEKIGCNGHNLESAFYNLTSGKLDTGLTYTNSERRESVVVIAKTSTALEFAQSLTHELGHLSCHIAQHYGIPLDGEEVRYINDGILEHTWPISRELLCDCCRNV